MIKKYIISFLSSHSAKTLISCAKKLVWKSGSFKGYTRDCHIGTYGPSLSLSRDFLGFQLLLPLYWNETSFKDAAMKNTYLRNIEEKLKMWGKFLQNYSGEKQSNLSGRSLGRTIWLMKKCIIRGLQVLFGQFIQKYTSSYIGQHNLSKLN